MGDDSRAPRWLLSAFSAVVVCFIASTVVSQLQAAQIGSLAESLWGDAMPSIEHLTSARTELRRVQAIAVRYPAGDEATRAQVMKKIVDAQRTIDDEIDAYLRLPPYPGEDAYWRDTRRALDDVDTAVATTRAFASTQDVAHATASLVNIENACDRASQALFVDIDFNAKQGAAIGRRIEELRHRSSMIAYALDALSVLLTGVVALFAIRAVSSHTKLLRRHNALLTERAGELEQFAGRVAHDIRSPISTATLSLAMVQRQPDLNPKIEEVAARGLSSLHRASRFVEGLLEFARAGAHPKVGARAEVRTVLTSLVADLRPSAEEAGISLESEELSESTVLCDPSILEVIVANLVRNAIKYMAESPERRIVVRAIDRSDKVRVEVEDTGPGIPPNLRKSVFEPFVRGPTSGQHGVGLGLATVKRICETHAGSAGVDAREGGGSLFWFELPRAT